MTVPVWSPGTIYLPGDIVKPVTKGAATPAALADPDFETTPAGTTLPGGSNWTVVNGHSFSGSKCAEYNGPSHGTGEFIFPDRMPINPGESASASCMFGRGSSSSNNAGGAIRIHFFDQTDTKISSSEGNIIKSGHNYVPSSVSAVAPPGTATFSVGANGFHNGSGSPFWVDNFTINYTPKVVNSKLLFKAVQPESGTSAGSEPIWPDTNGVQVIDGTVIWEAIGSGYIVWQAHPLLKSSGTEPLWPVVEGEYVSDGTISWETISTRITDPNCPNSRVVAIMAGKVFAADKDIVRFCATSNPLDWTTPEDAGYLPTGLQQANANDMAVLHPYRGNLAAWNASSFQQWQVDPDPKQMSILDQMDGIGSTWPRAAQAVGNDLLFLSQLGVRSVGIAIGADNLATGDIGTPIDVLVREALQTGRGALATYYPGAGQYWLSINQGGVEIVLWGYYRGGRGGVGICASESAGDGSLAFNSEIIGATSVVMTGWYSPEYPYEYPPPNDPMPIDLKAYTLHEVNVEFENRSDTESDWVGYPDMDSGQYIARFVVDGVTLYAAVQFSPGS